LKSEFLVPKDDLRTNEEEYQKSVPTVLISASQLSGPGLIFSRRLKLRKVAKKKKIKKPWAYNYIGKNEKKFTFSQIGILLYNGRN